MSITNISHYIQGNIVTGQSGRTQDVFNPAQGSVSGQVDLASAAEVAQAVAAAQAAFPAWSAMPPIRRARHMFRFLALLNEHKDA
ncbi:MAG: aldehyde dehydrogenase family protein, partial [Burkholderiaceae bacterium]|nr:aldehyde dehydrogenase family protein [Burkholderiaceae bacterium]